MRVHSLPAFGCVLSASLLLSACASAPRSAHEQETVPVDKVAPSLEPGVNRFEMTRKGQRMAADDFDAWMKAHGIRVAKGKPPPKQSKTGSASTKGKAAISSTQGRATEP